MISDHEHLGYIFLNFYQPSTPQKLYILGLAKNTWIECRNVVFVRGRIDEIFG